MIRLKPAAAVAIGFALALGSTGEARAQIGFAQNQADRVRLWNADYYEVAFRKSDGRLLYMVDKTTGGQQVSPGNVHGPWVLRFSDNTWLDGEQFSTTNPSRLFSYAWDAPNTRLTLDYVATGSQACHVTITVVPTTGPEVDCTLSITNQSGLSVELLAYPVQLAFLRSQIDAVYVPYMEGMKLLPSFFSSYDFTNGYPGQMFADFAFTDMSTGCFAVYTVQDRNEPLAPSAWAILRDTYLGGVNKYHHDYTLQLASSDTWTSPTTVLSIGSTLSQAMDAYWTRNGHDTIPTLEQKLGPTLCEKLSKAVLIKRDFLQGPWTFTAFQSALASIPAGSLLHFVAFWPSGFDEHYPDYLPPNAALGTLSQLQTLVATARSSGHLVMPYTNPTWWDDQSPTLGSLGTGIVSRDRQGNLIYENYGSHGGYVVNPFAAAVVARQDQTRSEFTQTVPCDFLFEDQLGARSSPMFANHPECPSPVQYIQGLLDVAERSSTWIPNMSEGGYDRMSEFETGYCLSQTVNWHWWPASTYTPYPMVPLWVHRNLYFSAHNLAGNVMANDLSKLTYYLSVGYSLTYDLATNNPSWLELLDCFQKQLVWKTIGVGMTGYENLPTNGQTRTTYENGIVVTANLTGGVMGSADHVMSANGFLAEQEGKVIGGALLAMHGHPLSGGSPHYLAINHGSHRIDIYQPSGSDGNLWFPRPVEWTEDARIHARAISKSGVVLDESPLFNSIEVGVNYSGSVSGQSTRYFSLIYCRAADTDCDGDIDGDDFLAFEACLSGPDVNVTPLPPMTTQDCHDAFDGDADADIDLIDLSAFQLQFDGAL